MRPRGQRAGHDFLRVPETIDGRGVDPVEAEFERPVNGADRVGVILGAPTEFPVATDGPRTESDAGDVQVRVTELFGFHVIKCVCLHARNLAPTGHAPQLYLGVNP
jgi:hypothetical protein